MKIVYPSIYAGIVIKNSEKVRRNKKILMHDHLNNISTIVL